MLEQYLSGIINNRKNIKKVQREGGNVSSMTMFYKILYEDLTGILYIYFTFYEVKIF